MLDRKTQDQIRQAMQTGVEETLETLAGECYAVCEETDEEYSHKWRDGEAVVSVCDETNDDPIETEYVYRVRVELVAVE